MKDYENMLLDIIARSSDGNDWRNQKVNEFYLDFSNPEHQEYFYAKYGGKDILEREFPKLYQLVQETIINTNDAYKNSTELEKEKIESRGSLKDGVKIRDVAYTHDCMGASGLVSLCNKTSQLYVSLSLIQNGKVIKRNCKFYHNVYNAVLDCTTPPMPKGTDGNITVVMNATWKDSATDSLKDCTSCLKSTIKEEEVVQSLILHHPSLYHPCIDPNSYSNPMPRLNFIKEDATTKQPLDIPAKTDDPATRTNINVCYRRIPREIERIDYIYPEERSEQNQLVFLDMRGEVVLNSGYKFDSITEFDIVLDCVENGVVPYNSIPKKDIHYYATEKGFNFVLPTSWKAKIPDSVMSGSRVYYLEADICFLVEGYSDTIRVNISSRDGISPLETHMAEIKPVRTFWGCLAEGTMIKMDDGSEKEIENIHSGDRVFSPDGVGKVVYVLRGTEDSMFIIKGKDMREICTTNNHPFKTTDGWVVAEELYSGYKLINDNGEPVSIQHHYLLELRAEVYNLVLEDVHSFCANGYIVGDNEIQGECINQRYEKDELDVDLEIEAECEKLSKMFG